jgi:hypothetical protein
MVFPRVRRPQVARQSDWCHHRPDEFVRRRRATICYELVIQLQQEIDSLKHNTHADRKTLARIRSEVRPAPWLALKEARAINDRELPLSVEVLPTDRIGRLYNILRKHIEELMEKPFPIEQFRGLITGNQVTDRMFEEARLVNSVYASGHGSIQKLLTEEKKAHEEATRTRGGSQAVRRQAARSPENNGHSQSECSLSPRSGKAGSNLALCNRSSRSWGDGKQEDRSAGARHSTRSFQRQRMGSILFHAFPQEVVD